MKGRHILVPTGCRNLDEILEGGFMSRRVYLIYGEAETGKTTLAIQASVNAARMKLKTIYVDTDFTFSGERLTQICDSNSEKVSPKILIVRPESFEMQGHVVDHLHEYTSDDVGMIVFDTITTLYRAEFGGEIDTFQLNRELNRQMAFLADVIKGSGTIALVTSQVTQPIRKEVTEDGKIPVEPVATRVLKFWADVILRLKLISSGRIVQASIEKGRGNRAPTERYLRIGDKGLQSFEREL